MSAGEGVQLALLIVTSVCMLVLFFGFAVDVMKRASAQNDEILRGLREPSWKVKGPQSRDRI